MTRFNPGAKVREETLKRLIRNSETIEPVTEILAGLEAGLLTAAARRTQAADIEGGVGKVPDEEARAEQLEGLIEASMNGTLGEFWIDEVASEHLEAPDTAKEYIGMDAEEWDAQLGRWADAYREQLPEGSDGRKDSDRSLAEHHVREVFGVDLETFEREIVEWDESEGLRKLMVGPTRTARDTFNQVTEEELRDDT